MKTLKEQPNESGTYVVVFRFKDESGNSLTPYGLSWFLSDVEGNAINSREDVAITAISGIANVVLSGNDLTPGWKILTLKGLYSSTYGTGLPLREAVKFYVRDLIEESL